MAHVNVFVRPRPIEDQNIVPHIVSSQQAGNEVLVRVMKTEQSSEKEFALDGYFNPLSTQDDIFSAIGEKTCAKVLSGFNSTVICFGPTASGKSYTIFGSEEKPGLAPHIIDHLFNQASKMTQQTFEFFISFCELYLDQPYDLLDETRSRPPSGNTIEFQQQTLKQQQDPEPSSEKKKALQVR